VRLAATEQIKRAAFSKVCPISLIMKIEMLTIEARRSTIPTQR